jgi:MFS family permease
MIARRTVLYLGCSQLLCWGISYYLIGALGQPMAEGLGWSASVVHGGFSLALLVMGLSSPSVGRAVDQYGGRPVMAAGSGLIALGCLGLAAAQGIVTHYAAWACLGLAMRMTLYDAAFAALARIGGPLARRPIAQITLLGGLASTVFWPVGHILQEQLGWRGALVAYAAIAALTVPLHFAIPRGRYTQAVAAAHATDQTPTRPRRNQLLAATLYGLVMTLTAFLNSGISAHMIGILAGLGQDPSAAVWLASLRGIGQSTARPAEVLFGAGLHPLSLGVLATGLFPLYFAAGLLSGPSALAGAAFTLLYGAGNGLVTIVRGTLPLVLFDPLAYGGLIGRFLIPSFSLSALGPLAYAVVIERLGEAAALYLSAALAGLSLAGALALRARFRS